jgi:hypothetical protein
MTTDPLARRAAALAQLVEARLPLEGISGGPAIAWPLVGPSLLALATATLKSIFVLRPHDDAHNDSSRLLRSLYDHVVTFAWLAVDPPARLDPWRKADLQERLKMAREFDAVGDELMSATARKDMEEVVASIEGAVPNLADMALDVDEYWLPRLPDLDGDGFGTFRGLYTILFREQSGLVHATMRGLNHVTIDLDPPSCKRVVMQVPLEGSRGPYGMATVVHCLGLLIAAQSLGWPDANEVRAILGRTH